MNKKLTFLFLTIIIFVTVNQLLSQWVELNSGVTTKLNSISSIKGITTWACGVNGTVIKSTDNGDTWQNGNFSGIPQNIILNHIYCLTKDIALAAGNDNSSSYVFKTYDGGSSWDIVIQQPGGKFNAVYFYDNNHGILVGNPVAGRWSIWKTVNSGDSWDSTGNFLAQNNNEKGFSNSLWASGNNIWFGTDNYRVYRTVNFGNSWNFQNTNSEKNTSSLWFDFDFNIGLSGSDNLIKTLNSGNTWLNETLPGTGSIAGVTGSAHSRFNWAIRNDKIYVNPHNETIWQYDYTSPAGNYTYITIERNGYFSGYVFAARDNGGISRTQFLSLGINPVSNEIPEKYMLYQNYPNPFNPATNFRFDLAENGSVNMKVFDVSGKEIETLVNELMTAGSYDVEWNASAYSSGIYFYKLVTNDFSETKKMILVK